MPDVVFVFDVLSPMLHPVVAKAGEVLVVRPGTDHPLLVVKKGTSTVLREGPPNYGALAGLLTDGIIAQRAVRPLARTG